MTKSRRTRQRGDTLVEVLIAILVVSMILTGAYATTNRSTKGIRDAQEHAEALKLVQGQLEQARHNATRPTQNIFDQPIGSVFCMVNGATVAAVVNPGAAQCLQNGSGNPTTDQPAYKLNIRRAACPAGFTAGCSQFTIQATWDSVTGRGIAMEQIVYRLYER